mmetsp:Transcript_14908/g.50258  ORF Transcript_14908/g.50258 Transcript_14908/m.50258 type:complete len:310 (+) Transcript_14908:396-1325(+)
MEHVPSDMRACGRPRAGDGRLCSKGAHTSRMELVGHAGAGHGRAGDQYQALVPDRHVVARVLLQRLARGRRRPRGRRRLGVGRRARRRAGRRWRGRRVRRARHDEVLHPVLRPYALALPLQGAADGGSRRRLLAPERSEGRGRRGRGRRRGRGGGHAVERVHARGHRRRGRRGGGRRRGGRLAREGLRLRQRQHGQRVPFGAAAPGPGAGGHADVDPEAGVDARGRVRLRGVGLGLAARGGQHQFVTVHTDVRQGAAEDAGCVAVTGARADAVHNTEGVVLVRLTLQVRPGRRLVRHDQCSPACHAAGG